MRGHACPWRPSPCLDRHAHPCPAQPRITFPHLSWTAVPDLAAPSPAYAHATEPRRDRHTFPDLALFSTTTPKSAQPSLASARLSMSAKPSRRFPHRSPPALAPTASPSLRRQCLTGPRRTPPSLVTSYVLRDLETAPPDFSVPPLQQLLRLRVEARRVVEGGVLRFAPAFADNALVALVVLGHDFEATE